MQGNSNHVSRTKKWEYYFAGNIFHRRIAMVILGASLIITLFAAYSATILQDNEKLSNELKTARADRDQVLESMVAVRYDELAGFGNTGHDNINDSSSDYLRIRVANNGSATAGFRFVLLYCISDADCPQSSDVPIISPASTVLLPSGATTPMSIVLNPGEIRELQVGPVLDGLKYRIDVITERGNILRTADCLVDLTNHTCKDGHVTDKPSIGVTD